MFNGSYEQQSNYVQRSGHGGQNPSSTSISNSSRVNAANNPSSSGLGFQYDSSQPDLQYQDFQYRLEDFQYQGFSQTIDSESDVASTQVSSLTHPTSLSPGNYSLEARSGHAATPYWQPMTSNDQSGQIRDAATFTEHPASVVPYPPSQSQSVQPPSPEVYARPNTQIPAPIWQLSQSWIDYEGGDDLYVIILFKKVQST